MGWDGKPHLVAVLVVVELAVEVAVVLVEVVLLLVGDQLAAVVHLGMLVAMVVGRPVQVEE